MTQLLAKSWNNVLGFLNSLCVPLFSILGCSVFGHLHIRPEHVWEDGRRHLNSL